MDYAEILEQIEEAIESGVSLLLDDLTPEAQAIVLAHDRMTGQTTLPSRAELEAA